MLRAAEKRLLAEKCLKCAQKGNFREAARIRQRAYAENPPGSIGVDWNDWPAIWAKDKHYLSFLKAEKFVDLKNSKKYIESMKASIFVDYLFDFRDGWGLEQHRAFCPEVICCPLLDKFLHDLDLELETKDSVYMATVKRNVDSKIYIDSTKCTKLDTNKYPYMSYVYPAGEYHLGILKGTPDAAVERVLDGRRKFLKEYDLYEHMGKCGIEKFPKTFQTFQKHKKENSEKYQEWMRQYSIIVQNSRR